MTQAKPRQSPNPNGTVKVAANGSTLPPFDEDLEEQVVGSLIADDALLFRVAPLINEADFYSQRLGLVYSHIVAMKGAGHDVDLVSLSRAIEDAGHTQNIGGDIYLSKLLGQVISTHAVTTNARKLSELAARRRTLFACSEIARAAYDTTLSLDEIANKAQGSITQALIGNSQRQTLSIKEIASDWFKEFEEFVTTGKIKGIPTPYPTQNGQTGGWVKTKMYLVSAPTGVGKSTYLKSAALHAAKLGHPVGIWTLEMSEQEYFETLVAEYGEFDTMPGNIVNMSQDKREQLLAKAKWARAQVELLPITIMHRPGLSTDQWFFEARALKSLGRLELAIHDYVQLATPPSWFDQKDNREQAMAQVSRSLKEGAQRMQIPLLTAAQLNKQGDVRESKAIEFNTDFHLKLLPLRGSERLDPQTRCKMQTLKAIVEKNRSGDKNDFFILFNRSHKKLGETSAPKKAAPQTPPASNQAQQTQAPVSKQGQTAQHVTPPMPEPPPLQLDLDQ